MGIHGAKKGRKNVRGRGAVGCGAGGTLEAGK